MTASKSTIWRRDNLERARANARAYHAADPERQRWWWIKSQYGVTKEQYLATLELQEGRCAICRGDSPGPKKNWHVDHCHDTGSFRGLLCHFCNVMLGNAKDNPDRLRSAANYLERARAEA